MKDLLEQLARVNISGAPFLLSYGMTWIVCGIIWQKAKSHIASLATLFQGMVALPAALFIMYLIGAFENRPEVGDLNSLVIIIAMSQLLAIPLLIAMFRKEDFTMIPFVFSIAGAVHFLMYAWLYQTVAYIVMPVIIAVLMAIVYVKDKKEKGAAAACFGTGIILIMTGLYFIVV